MTIESATYISDLNTANPGSNDLKSEGDDHIRLVKSTLKTTFPNITGAVTLTQAQLNAFATGGSPSFTNVTASGSGTFATLAASGAVTAGGTVTIGGVASQGKVTVANGTYTGEVALCGTLEPTRYGAKLSAEVVGGSSALYFYVNQNNSGMIARGQFDSASLSPYVTNTYSCGTSGLRWSNVYATAGNFTGTVTAAAFSGALSGPISQFTNDSGYATSAGTVAAAGTLTGGTLAANVVNSSLTSISSNATDGTYELGFKGLPAASVTTGAFVATDRGKCVYATAGVTIPNSTMVAGDVVTIINTTASAITLTAAIGTLRQAGTANIGTRTLAGYGIASVAFVSSVIGFISGVGLT